MEPVFPQLETSRLVLTRIGPADAQFIFELFADPKVVEYCDLEPFLSVDEAVQLIGLFASRFDAGSGIRWAIRERGSESLVGTCGFNSWNKRMRHGTIGFDLKRPYWGRGMMTEAASAVIRAAFSSTLSCGKLHRIQADTMIGNVASERVLTKLGFKEEGIRQGAAYIHGSYRDMKCFGMVHRDET
jgi:ribosomal-protein-alanine N-acetyltransferase